MVQKEVERYASDADYFEEHRSELLREHPERWVAVYNHEVIGIAKGIKHLIKQLDRKGIPPAQAYREYLTESQEQLILTSRRR